jgi:hypothetical protein
MNAMTIHGVCDRARGVLKALELGWLAQRRR